jgi:glycosyltransferase involved in cell wall biosynthesis
VKGPLVTTIIPVFNAERFLAEAIESSLGQSYEPVEVIVVDDGSTDGSADVAARYPEVKLIRQENAGPAAARNAAIRAGSGELIANLDADDFSHPDRLAIQVGYLMENPDAALVMARQVVVREPGIELPDWVLDPRSALDGVSEALPPKPGEDLVPYYQPNSMVIRRSVLDQVGLYDPSFFNAEDVDLIFRVIEAGLVVGTIDEHIYNRRFHGDNMTYDPASRRAGVMKAFKARIDRGRARNASS